MKILNLYAGIGGNRKLWKNVDITAVEYDKKIAEIYHDNFPEDKIIVGDAHQYLLEHYKEFDFIWSSPPCPSHSDIRRMGTHAGQYKAIYPEMSLYQEIILLQTYARKDTKYVVENVIPYYKPLIAAQEIHRHLFWSNFYIHEFHGGIPKHHETIKRQQEITGFDLSKYNGIDKRKILRNCVDSKLGLHILASAYKNIQERLF